MIIRKTRIEELEAVMAIYARAAEFMAQTGNPNQWVNGYPSREIIEADIKNGVSYVVDENGSIEAVFVYIEGIDPTYDRIDNGAWKTDGIYATVHRVASAGRKKGIGRICFTWSEAQAASHGCVSLRADTHADNKVMQRVLASNGFIYCGVIYTADGAPRLAYEKPLWQSKQKGGGIAFGVASMVLGITSLLLFCTCVNFVLAILAIIFGIVQLMKHKERAFAITGIVTAVLSILLGIFLWVLLAAGMTDMTINGYSDIYEYYYGDEFDYDDYGNDHHYDGYYDAYDGDEYDYDDLYDGAQEDGARFLQLKGPHIIYR